MLNNLSSSHLGDELNSKKFYLWNNNRSNSAASSGRGALNNGNAVAHNSFSGKNSKRGSLNRNRKNFH